MKRLFTLIALIFAFNSYAQINFEKGYYIDNSGQKFDCLIKNMDWENNPISFKYKTSENGEVQEKDVSAVREFGIIDFSKHVRRKVAIDRSSEEVQKLSSQRQPIFQEEELFLKVLIEGDASLLYYQLGNLKRYFYSLGDAKTEQLVFKSYRTAKGNIGKNNQYKQQVLNALKCETLHQNDFENLKYENRSLIPLFEKYNNCKGGNSVNFDKKVKRDLFNLSLRPRLNSSTMTLNNAFSELRNTELDRELSFGFGVEMEFILPFNKNKWAIILEPAYQYYKSSNEIAEVDYKSIEVPLGIRHYFFLNEDSKIMVNAAMVFDLMLDSELNFRHALNLDLRTDNNLAFGVGYKFKEKYSFEVNYQKSGGILALYDSWNSDFKTLSLIFGYTIL